MTFIADLHIHSRYSRATSNKMNVENLYKWAQIKGVTLIATGDFTHPSWFAELLEKLEPAETGLFMLKEKYCGQVKDEIPLSCRSKVRFILSAEVSSIYSKGGRVRKVHSLMYAPDFETASKINTELAKIGNIKSDGRPILGLDVKELLQIMLNINTDCMYIPAHAWTPHFSVFGSGSGFDSLEECFEDLTPQIFAIETGLSSDPKMNWRLSALDNITLISNSDAHSLAKIAREANIFNCDLTYPAVAAAIKEGIDGGFCGTIEFFPEEGKYHYDGHRSCQVRMDPKETITNNFLCPKCNKKVTVGVMHRVFQLADRDEGYTSNKFPPYRSLIPLAEIISEVIEKGVGTKTVTREYMRYISVVGNELSLLLDADIKEIQKIAGDEVARAVEKVRHGKVEIYPGYDGEYGKIKISQRIGNNKKDKQMSLFC